MRSEILSAARRGILIAIVSFYPALGVAADTADPGLAERPDAVLAGQVRQQGHLCDKSLEAHRDEALSRADEPVWILTCSNATYRIRLRPDMKARIEPIESAQ
jgi:hypothetical protein